MCAYRMLGSASEAEDAVQENLESGLSAGQTSSDVRICEAA
jgi:DNA-directed RNA polymerase specialized sigma24 family protein